MNERWRFYVIPDEKDNRGEYEATGRMVVQHGINLPTLADYPSCGECSDYYLYSGIIYSDAMKTICKMNTDGVIFLSLSSVSWSKIIEWKLGSMMDDCCSNMPTSRYTR